MSKLKANGPSILRVGFDPERIAKMRPSEVDDLAYHIARVIRGEASAVMEWEAHGMKVDLVPWKR